MPRPSFLALALLASLAACPHHSARDPVTPHAGSATPDAGAAPVATGPTERECDALIDHAIELHLAELRQAQPADRLPTDAELATLRGELRADPGCRALAGDAYRCGMAARSLAELSTCGAPTPSAGSTP